MVLSSDRVKRKKKACPKLLVVFSSGVEIDRPGADRNNRYREPEKVSDVLSLFHLYAYAMMPNAQMEKNPIANQKSELASDIAYLPE